MNAACCLNLWPAVLELHYLGSNTCSHPLQSIRSHVMPLFGQQLEDKMWSGFHQLLPATILSSFQHTNVQALWEQKFFMQSIQILDLNFLKDPLIFDLFWLRFPIAWCIDQLLSAEGEPFDYRWPPDHFLECGRYLRPQFEAGECVDQDTSQLLLICSWTN